MSNLKHLYQNNKIIKCIADIGGVVANVNLAFFIAAQIRTDIAWLTTISYITTSLQVLIATTIAFFACQMIETKQFINNKEFKKQLFCYKRKIIILGIFGIAFGVFMFLPIAILATIETKKTKKEISKINP